MLCDRMISKMPSIAIFFVAILFSTMSFIGSNFEQSEGMNQTIMESTNQTLQNMSQTLQNMNQTTNNTAGETILQKNSTDLGSNLTEIAKKLAKSIDEGIKNLSQ